MPDDLVPATVAEIAESLRYSLRFGRSGKAHGKGMREDAPLMATWLAQHMLMSNFVVYRRLPRPAGTGLCGDRPDGASASGDPIRG